MQSVIVLLLMIGLVGCTEKKPRKAYDPYYLTVRCYDSMGNLLYKERREEVYIKAGPNEKGLDIQKCTVEVVE